MCAFHGTIFNINFQSLMPYSLSGRQIPFVCFVQDIKVEGLVTMKAIMERRKVEIKEEEEAAEAKQTAEREVRIRNESGSEGLNCFL